MDQRRSEIIEGSLSIVTTPTSQIISTLDELLARVSGISGKFVSVLEGLINFNSAIGRWLTWAAVISTLILLWISFSQVGLFVLAWRFFTGEDLLEKKEQDALADV